MQKLNATKMIDFRSRSERSRLTFAINFQKPEKEEDGGGGDYWIPATSAMANAWKENDSDIIHAKIESLTKLVKTTSRTQTKDMYQRNSKMLSPYNPYDFSDLRPKQVIGVKWVPKTTDPINIKGLFVQVFPSYVFMFKNKDIDEVGAVWFVARQQGFKKEELAVFAELMYRFLTVNYRKKFFVNPDFCFVMDIMKGATLQYSDVADGKVDAQVDKIISDLKKLLR